MAGAAIGGAVASGSMDMFSTMLGNVASAKAAKRARKFYEDMRATVYQTMVKDLRAAGLNPALAFGHGSASPGSAPVIKADVDMSNMKDMVSRAVSSAKQAGTVGSQMGISQAAESKAKTDALYAGPRADAEIDLMDSQAVRNFEEAKLAISKDTESSARTRQIAEQEIATRVNRLLGEAELPAARARAGFDASEVGETLNQVRRALDLIPGLRGFSGSSSRRSR